MRAQRDIINQHLARFGAKVGLSRLRLDDEGFAALQILDMVITVNIYSEQKLAVFSAAIGELPAQVQDALFREVIRAQEFGVETGGSFFTVDDARKVWLCHGVVVANITYEDFEAVLENLFAFAQHWKQELDTLISRNR